MHGTQYNQQEQIANFQHKQGSSSFLIPSTIKECKQILHQSQAKVSKIAQQSTPTTAAPRVLQASPHQNWKATSPKPKYSTTSVRLKKCKGCLLNFVTYDPPIAVPELAAYRSQPTLTRIPRSAPIGSPPMHQLQLLRRSVTITVSILAKHKEPPLLYFPPLQRPGLHRCHILC